MSLAARTIAGRVATTLALMAPLACSDDATGPGPSSDLFRVQLQRQRWEALNITEYSYRLVIRCFCGVFPNEVFVAVRDGQIVGVTGVLTGEVVDASRFEDYLTVDGLFAELTAALTRPPDEVQRLEFDDDLYFPTEIDIDFDLRVADEEMRFSAGPLARQSALTSSFRGTRPSALPRSPRAPLGMPM